MRQT
jgi:hypothetical protein